MSGGTMKLLEARDAFDKAGGTYERAQVVRLDSRWIRMLRYHLGTIFEDTFIPADGETDSRKSLKVFRLIAFSKPLSLKLISYPHSILIPKI